MRRLAACAVVLVVVGAGAVPAFAHGDPAGETLLTSDVFVSRHTRGPVGRTLEAMAAEAKREDLPMKVAVVSEIADLGPDASLYGHAQPYAQHLAGELSSTYVGTIVVAMNGRPGGFAVVGPGATPAAKRALAAMKLPKTPPTAAELAAMAATAVQRVAAASGHRLAATAAAGAKKETSTKLLDVFLIAAIGLAALGAGAALLARWLRGGRSAPV